VSAYDAARSRSLISRWPQRRPVTFFVQKGCYTGLSSDELLNWSVTQLQRMHVECDYFVNVAA
jgi:hypothetical protein